jgi:hypothetical protein
MTGLLHINPVLGTSIPQYSKHRIIHTTHQALEDKEYYTSIFLDVTPLQNQKGVPYSILYTAEVVYI